MELFKASRQWSERPADERFESLQSLYDATRAYAQDAAEKRVPFGDLRVEAIDGDVQLVGRSNNPAKLTHWAFGQLCQKLEAPASYLRDLPATLACQNLNHGLARRMQDAAANSVANLLFHKNGTLLLRSILTDSYSRIWNYEIGERLLDLEAQGWQPALPTKHWNGQIAVGTCIACGGQGGDCDKCKGTGREFPALYASDHDMFAFLMNKNTAVCESAAGSGFHMYRGVIVENSEVGASALKLTRFLFDEMCGNHIIWGASDVVDISVRHVGSARQRWGIYAAQIRKYAESSVSDEQAKIAAAKGCIIGASKDEVLDALFGKRTVGLSRKMLESGYDAVNPTEDSPANTKWGMVQGLTRFSQTIPYADKRNDVDRAAGRIMEIEF